MLLKSVYFSQRISAFLCMCVCVCGGGSLYLTSSPSIRETVTFSVLDDQTWCLKSDNFLASPMWSLHLISNTKYVTGWCDVYFLHPQINMIPRKLIWSPLFQFKVSPCPHFWYDSWIASSHRPGPRRRRHRPRRCLHRPRPRPRPCPRPRFRRYRRPDRRRDRRRSLSSCRRSDFICKNKIIEYRHQMRRNIQDKNSTLQGKGRILRPNLQNIGRYQWNT